MENTMKTLIVEDDFTCRFLLQKLLDHYGQCHIAVNGKEAVHAAKAAMDANEPYDLICLDIMMPEMDGQTALKEIRGMEETKGVLSSKGSKIIMTTALNDMKNVSTAYNALCDGYLVKPIEKARLTELLGKMKLVG